MENSAHVRTPGRWSDCSGARQRRTPTWRQRRPRPRRRRRGWPRRRLPPRRDRRTAGAAGGAARRRRRRPRQRRHREEPLPKLLPPEMSAEAAIPPAAAAADVAACTLQCHSVICRINYHYYWTDTLLAPVLARILHKKTSCLVKILEWQQRHLTYHTCS